MPHTPAQATPAPSSAAELAAASRAAQGLPARIEDPASLARVAVLLRTARKEPREPAPDAA